MKQIIAVPLIFLFDGAYLLYLLKDHQDFHCFSEYEIKIKEEEIPKDDKENFEKIVKIFYDRLYSGVLMASKARGFLVGSKSVSLIKHDYNNDRDTLYVYFCVISYEKPEQKDHLPYEEVFVPAEEVHRRIVGAEGPFHIDIGHNILNSYFEGEGKWLLAKTEKA